MRQGTRSTWMHASLALIVIVLLVAVPLAHSAAPTASAATAKAPVDLAAMAINPLDLEPFGLTGYGIGDARYLDTGSAANLLAESFQRPAGTIRPVLDRAGFVDAYTLTNDQIGAGNPGTTALVSSTTLLLPDDASAGSAYQGLTGWTGIDGITIDSNDAGVADESQIVSFASGGGEAPTSSTSLLTLRSGSYVAIVVLSATTSAGDSISVATPIGTRLAQKIGIVAGGNAPDLSYRGLMFADSAPASGLYMLAYGGDLRLASETDDAFANRPYLDAGMTDLYRETWLISPSRNAVTVTIDLASFDSGSDGNAWVANAPMRLDAGRATGTTANDSATRIGDRSTDIIYRSSDGKMHRQIVVQSGTSIFSIDVEAASLPVIAEMQSVARVQLACVQQDVPCEAIPLPFEFAAASPIGVQPTLRATATPAIS